jgi:hypothetical protein
MLQPSMIEGTTLTILGMIVPPIFHISNDLYCAWGVPMHWLSTHHLQAFANSWGMFNKYTLS